MGMTIGLTMNATEMSRRMPGVGGPPPQGRGGPDQLIEDAAKAIGISKGDLQSQLKSGASIADVAKASGVALDDLKSRMIRQSRDVSPLRFRAGASPRPMPTR